MLEIALVLIVAVLGAFVFLSLSKIAPTESLAAAPRVPLPKTKVPPQQVDQPKKIVKAAKASTPVEETAVRKSRGRTVPGLGMEADVLRLTTTEDKANERAQSAKKAEAEKKLKIKEEAAEAPVEKKSRAAKKAEEGPKVDAQLEFKKQVEAMNARLEKFMGSQNKEGKKNKEQIGSISAANMKVSKDIRSTTAPWKAN